MRIHIKLFDKDHHLVSAEIAELQVAVEIAADFVRNHGGDDEDPMGGFIEFDPVKE